MTLRLTQDRRKGLWVAEFRKNLKGPDNTEAWQFKRIPLHVRRNAP